MPHLDLVQPWPRLCSRSSSSYIIYRPPTRRCAIYYSSLVSFSASWSLGLSLCVWSTHVSLTWTLYLTLSTDVDHFDVLDTNTLTNQEACYTTHTNSRPWLVRIMLEPTHPKLDHLALTITYNSLSVCASTSQKKKKKHSYVCWTFM